MSDYALSASNIFFRYPGGGGDVLSGLELSVSPGEIVGVIGPNGSGKTTLLNILSWSLQPDRGEVLIFGRPAGSLSARERARLVAAAPQEPRTAFPFTVMEIVLMGRSPFLGRWELEGSGDVARAGEALAITGLTELAGRGFHQLSGGEKQRVMVAKALAQESRALLLDEPTAFLDLKHQVEIYELMAGLARQKGMAVLAVSHDINLAAAYCDRVAVLSEGRIVADGAPGEVLDPVGLEKVYGVKVGIARADGRGGVPLVFPLGKSMGSREAKGS